MAISPARKVAFDVLLRVEAEAAYASDLLHTELSGDVGASDAALATEITLGVLRQRRLLDFLLARHSKKQIERFDLPVAIALRMALYQLRFLERVPARAAVHESVELVKRARKSSAASLVNAILRRCADDAKTPAESFLAPAAILADRLGILHSHPTWIVERWLARFGEARTVALLEANNRPPHLSCALSDEKNREETFAILRAEMLQVTPGRLLRSAFTVASGSPSRTAAFREGRFSIQDEASQAIPLLLGVQPGDKVLDLCAAPGGKTATLVRAAGESGLVIAGDRYTHRLRATAAQFQRLKLGAAHLVELDASQPLPFRTTFDCILVDAPCSGTGTLARHPEIRWRLREQQLTEFHNLQKATLIRALDHLAPGGRLVYSTCSLEPEENERVMADVLREVPRARRVAPDDIARTLARHLADGVSAASFFDSLGQFRTFPADLPIDGFFAAALEMA
jgi:16S rRNA (cytosine967-C5)-methyltransferase